MERDISSGTERATMREDSRRTYLKGQTIFVDIEGENKVSMMEMLRAVKAECGEVFGCIYRTNTKYEVTMTDPGGKEKLKDGIMVNGCRVMGREYRHDELVVSFLGLPTYITDEEIEARLEGWGVHSVSPIKRRMWPGTDIADGTRFCRVKFNEKVQSLPYSAKFHTIEGDCYYRVIHDRQAKVCRLCIRPGHILRECPDFTCHKCGKQGHYARECSGFDPNFMEEKDGGEEQMESGGVGEERSQPGGSQQQDAAPEEEAGGERRDPEVEADGGEVPSSAPAPGAEGPAETQGESGGSGEQPVSRAAGESGGSGEQPVSRAAGESDGLERQVTKRRKKEERAQEDPPAGGKKEKEDPVEGPLVEMVSDPSGSDSGQEVSLESLRELRKKEKKNRARKNT